MACCRLLSVWFLIPVFIFFFVLLLASSPSSAQRVALTVHYEALCPFCADFIVNHLSKLFQNGLISAVDLRLVPWGNSLVRPDGTIVCQHGAAECMLNTVEACTIYAYPDVGKHFNFVYCTEVLALENRLSEWANCLEITGLGNDPIDCYRSGYGDLLERRYAAETSQLNPPHGFVPWVLVNNQPLQEDYQNFVNYICNAFGSNQMPDACKVFYSSLAEAKQDGEESQACFAHQAKDLKGDSASEGGASLAAP